jgi:hypothetical protein
MISDFGVSLSPSFFPAQKKSEKEKNDKWYLECVNAGLNLTYWNTNNINGVRASRRNKLVNYNLFNDIIDKTEVERVTNPFKFENIHFPSTYRNYPLLNANINLLLGEERKRMFNPVVTVVNDDVTNKKLELLNDEFVSMIVESVHMKNFSEEQVKSKIEELTRLKLNYRDRRERMVDQIIQYGYRAIRMKELFSRGFEDLLIAGEEIYIADIYGGEPILRKGNPLNFSTLRSGESPYIEDSDIIVEDGYLPIGEVIDRYYEFLTEKEIEMLEHGHNTNKGGGNSSGAYLLNRPGNIGEFVDIGINNDNIGEILLANRDATFYYGGYFDAEGNVRCTRVVWKSLRKVGTLSYFDEDGNVQKKYVPEQYKPNKDQGENVEWIWITEWYEGTKIGADIYVKMQPLGIKMQHADNPSMCKPGIVGVSSNVNSSRAKSLMDYGKDYQYLFNAFMYRLELLHIKNKGKIGKLPLHLIPNTWPMEKAMYYIEMLGWMPIDAFNEGMKGNAQGKLGGSMNESSPVIDMELSNSIQQTYLMLDFIKRQVDDLTGVTSQRKGAIDNRETVGGIERGVTQSSMSTEKWFGLHELGKIKALEAYVEAAKIAWDNKSFVRNFVTDDGTQQILDFDGSALREIEHGICISTLQADQEMYQALKSNATALIQAGAPTSLIMKLYKITNPATLQREVESFEDKQNQIRQQASDKEDQKIALAAQMEQYKVESELNLEERKIDEDSRNKQLDRELKIQLATIEGLAYAEDKDVDKDNIPDVIEQSKVALEQSKHSFNTSLESRKLKLEEKKQKDDTDLKKKELKIKDKQIDTQLKIAKTNRNKYSK